ncbi:MAG: AAA family ATPase [Anaerolineales bacterium]
MKILAFLAENIKRLTVVSIRPDGNLVEITGKNGAGKSSVLDSLWWCLSGTSGISSAPIRDGTDEALVSLDLGEIKVTRKFRRKDDASPSYTTSLIVEAQDGSHFRSPQTMLDGMLGAFSFDPLAFTRLLPRQQFDSLKGFVPGIDFDKIETENARDFERRTEENRKAKELRAQMAGLMVPEGASGSLQDLSALARDLEAAGEKNREISERKARRDQATQRIDFLNASADKAQEQIAALTSSIERLRSEAATAREEAKALAARLDKAAPLPEPVDTSGLGEKIAQAEKANETAKKASQRAELETLAIAHEAQATALSEAMAARTAHKQAAIAAAEMPVPGLGFGDGEITLNGRPFGQASDAEQLRTSVAIAIAGNPRIRVIRVRDGSLLDEDGLRLLAGMADQHDCQVWIERVTNGARIGFTLEDGHLKND